MSRKKKRKKQRQRIRASAPARFTLGDQVRVKAGTTDPDYPDMPLGGWTGTITDVELGPNQSTYLVEWNQRTLDHMHPVYRKRCQRDSADIGYLWLYEKDLEPDAGEPAIIEQPTKIVTRPLRKNDPEDRIRAIFELTSDDPLPWVNEENLGTYHGYLASRLSLPFEAKFSAPSDPFTVTEYTVRVVELLDPGSGDEQTGLLCRATQGAETVELPLAAVEVSGPAADQQLVEDHAYWFWNAPHEEGAEPSFAGPPSYDLEPSRASRWGLVLEMVKWSIGVGVVGGGIGSVIGAIDGAALGAGIGAIVVALLGGLLGAKDGRIFGAVNRISYGPLAGGFFGTVAGAMVGAPIGALVVAFTGAVPGGILGGVGGRLLASRRRKSAATVWGAVAGSGLGSVVLAFYQDRESALAGGAIGGLLGMVAGAVLLLAIVGFLMLVGRQRRHEWRL